MRRIGAGLFQKQIHSWHRLSRKTLSLVCGLTLALLALPVAARQGTINPRIPPPPPEQPKPEAPSSTASTPASKPPQPASKTSPGAPATPKSDRGAGGLAAGPEPLRPEPTPPSLPPSVVIPAGTRIAVVLDTPLSTRIARRGQLVTFRTSDPLNVHDQLEIPPETAFNGTVVEAKRPGSFGRAGALRVKVDRISLSTGASKEVVARLDSPDMKGGGRLKADKSRATDLYSLATYGIQGTLVGLQIGGGKGAAIGAGAGSAVALIIMMSRRGADLYLEPGMPFLVILDQPVEWTGSEVYAAQQAYARSRGSSGTTTGSDSSVGPDTQGAGSKIERDPDDAVLDSDRPKLKRRPKTPQP